MEKKKLENLEVIFLVSIGAFLLGFILPWIKVPVLGSFNALNVGLGVAIFFLVAISGGIFFWRKDISQSSLFVLSGLLLLLFIERIVSLGSMGFSLELGILGEISIFNFLGSGIYLTIVASLSLFVSSLNLLKNKNPQAFKTSAIILGVLLVLELTYLIVSGINFSSLA